MDADFWINRWAEDRIGFHQKDVNPYLLRHWPRLALSASARVLVPLCGKSQDMAWLAGQGHAVLGVELSEKAVRAFFEEQGLQPEVSQREAFTRYVAGTLELWCGDFFALSEADVADCRGMFDRAALIALPEPMRRRYVDHMTRILPAGCRGLLVTLDYEQEKMEGPPFAVPEEQVQELFAADWLIEHVERCDVLGKNWRFDPYGLNRTDESVFALTRRS